MICRPLHALAGGASKHTEQQPQGRARIKHAHATPEGLSRRKFSGFRSRWITAISWQWSTTYRPGGGRRFKEATVIRSFMPKDGLWTLVQATNTAWLGGPTLLASPPPCSDRHWKQVKHLDDGADHVRGIFLSVVVTLDDAVKQLAAPAHEWQHRARWKHIERLHPGHAPMSGLLTDGDPHSHRAACLPSPDACQAPGPISVADLKTDGM